MWLVTAVTQTLINPNILTPKMPTAKKKLYIFWQMQLSFMSHTTVAFRPWVN